MGKQFTLTTTDSHTLGAYRADPAGKPKGGIVVVQEIFGVNHHIRAVCDRLAARGYVAVAPAVFDRFVRDFEMRLYAGRSRACAQLSRQSRLGQDDARHGGARRPRSRMPARSASSASAWAAPRLSRRLPPARLAAAVGYYGGSIAKFIDEKPKCPVQMHFGEKDARHSVERRRDHQAEAAGGEVYVYPKAPHGFNCDERASYKKEARAGVERTQEFLAKNMK